MIFSLNYLDFFDFQDSPNKNHVQNDFVYNFMSMKVDDACGVAQSLYYAMINPKLHYHTPVHILSMFQYAEKLKWDLLFYEKLAIWFHDAIYIPGNPTNEEQSADFMMALLKGRENQVQLEVAYKSILDTAKHHEKFDHVINNRVLDLDLWTLGAKRGLFQKVNDLIRLEFKNVEDEPYELGRKQFMSKMTEKGFIYRTKEFQDKESQAWENLKVSVFS